MRLLFAIDMQDYAACTYTFVRNSARSIILRGGKVAMIHSLKQGYYKLPGGGLSQAAWRRQNVALFLRECYETVHSSGCGRFGISPKGFIDEVVTERLPNPFMPDDPRRIATDTSQKVGIRFGETIKSYVAEGRDLGELVSIPLAIAGWMRYLLGVGDDGEAIEISADPMKDELMAKLAGIELGKPETYKGQLREILSNEVIFGSDLCKAGLADRIEQMALLLKAIRHRRGISIEELAEKCGLGYARTVELTSRLETDGFISTDLLQRCSINPVKK